MIDFENGHRFEVMVSQALKGKAGKGFNWTKFYQTFAPEVMTPRELAVHIWRGYSFTPVWKQSARREGEFCQRWAYRLRLRRRRHNQRS
jgi:hypothetical protein